MSVGVSKPSIKTARFRVQTAVNVSKLFVGESRLFDGVTGSFVVQYADVTKLLTGSGVLKQSASVIKVYAASELNAGGVP